MLEICLRLIVLTSLVVLSICFAQQQRQSGVPSSTEEDSLKRFLQNYLNHGDKTTRYSVAFKDLNGDGTQEAIVYITGGGWCGSGGCVTLILARNSHSYRIVNKITITQPPIRVLANASNGWRNIGVWVQGGGVQPGYEAELRFDGKTYPSNPSTPPARRLVGRVAGETVISPSDSGKPVYP